jgi:hypothetical protein
MHQSYPDILERMTALLRNAHAETKDHGEGPSPHCRDEIDPDTNQCQCVAEPRWWDDHGVPRFAEHHPNLAPDIYADEVALLVISCQGCGQEFHVQMTWSTMDAARILATSGTPAQVSLMLERAWAVIDGTRGGKRADVFPEIAADRATFAELRDRRPERLSEQIAHGTIHYGDPPNTGCCAAGGTMNCWDLRVVEYWARSFTLRKLLDPTNTSDTMKGDECLRYEWTRVPAFEIELPDATEANRT